MTYRPDLLDELLPAGTAAAWMDPAAEPEPLYAEELPAAALAIEKRRREFAIGRTCARRALQLLGAPTGAIPVNPNRSPAWPAGIVGAITHCQGLVAAVVGWQAAFNGLGIDAEPAQPPLESRLLRLICTPAENALLPARPPLPDVDWPRVVFSAKEAVYKAVAPAAGMFLGFQDVELDFGPVSHEPGAIHSFSARLVRDPDARIPDFADLHGRFAVRHGLLLTAAYLLHPRGSVG